MSAMRKMAVYLGLVEDDDRYQDKYDSYAEYEEYDEADRMPIPEEADMRTSRDEYSRDDYGSYHTDWRAEHVPQASVDRITTLHPRTYNEARTIGEQFRE